MDRGEPAGWKNSLRTPSERVCSIWRNGPEVAARLAASRELDWFRAENEFERAGHGSSGVMAREIPTRMLGPAAACAQAGRLGSVLPVTDGLGWSISRCRSGLLWHLECWISNIRSRVSASLRSGLIW